MGPAGNKQALLRVENLRVAFSTRRGTLVAVDDISFHIDEGEVLGVVGESGAGKSLTGAAIIGLLERPGRIADGQRRQVARIGERKDLLKKIRAAERFVGPPGRAIENLHLEHPTKGPTLDLVFAALRAYQQFRVLREDPTALATP